MTRLAIVDGTNAVLRRLTVQEGELPLEEIVRGTALNILDFVREVGATHVVVCFDSAHSLRRDRMPQYKADRHRDTGPPSKALLEHLRLEHNIACVGLRGYEADDCIATLAKRNAGRLEVCILSSDHDLLPLLSLGARCFQYAEGGGFVERDAAFVMERFGVMPDQVPSYFALVGGKNGLKGVPGIGKKRAPALLAAGEVTEQLSEGQVTDYLNQLDVLRLIADVPLPQLTAAYCQVPE